MSIIGSNILAGAAGSGVSAYEIEQSLRFDGSAYLSLGTGTTHTTTNYTISFWMKPCEIGTAGIQPNIFRTVGNNNTETNIQNAYNWNATGTNKLGSYWHQTNSGNNYDGGITSAVYRDPSAWYHVVCAIDTTQSTAVDRCKYFVNGVEQAATVGSNPIPQNYSPVFRNFAHRIGEDTNWYLAEYHLTTDGTKAATDFGEYDDNGVWRPIEYTGNYGTFGFYLKFDPSATNGIGHDHSGNGLHWTPTGFTTSGTGTDVMSDTPTTNYCTWNPLFKQGNTPTYSEGNLVNSGSNSNPVLGTIGVSSGKWYWEVTPSSNSALIGICGPVLSSYSGNLYDQSTGYCYGHDGRKGHAGSLSSYGASYTSNDKIGIALDLDAGTLVFYKNGTSQGTAFTGLSGTFFPAVSNWGASISFTLNCGQRAFEQTVPTGYKALNTSNLPAPDIKDGSLYFDTLTYTGPISSTAAAGTTGAVTGLASGFTPDLVWIKCRNQANWHQLFDQVRGVDANGAGALNSNDTGSEVTTNLNGGLSAFNDGGFTVIAGSDSGGRSNNTGSSDRTYAAWNWLEGATQGFDIVTGTGGTAENHNLGFAPDFVIFKYRNAVSDWNVYHKDATSTSQRLKLNSTAAVESISTSWTINSANFAYGGGSNTWVAYLFAEVEGYSKFGSYEGNGTIGDGPFVYCGFRPAFVLTKNADAVDDWSIEDATRDPYNLADASLRPNSSSAEDGAATIDILSNGFKVRTGDSHRINFANETFIFAAFASNPFGGSGVSPATAR